MVIWFYARNGEHLRCEVRHSDDGDGCELIVTTPDGSERVERFDSPVLLHQRSRQLEREWLATGWDGPFGRGY